MTKSKITQAEIDAAKTQYAAEVEARWGHTEAWKQQKDPTPATLEGAEEIFAAFAAQRGTDPAAPEVQALVQSWQAYITAHFYPCSKEILRGLGQMYVCDERFTANLDKHGEGTAKLMAEAIAIFCKE